MPVTFNGADLTVDFEEVITNGAELKYKIEYVCATTTVTHYVDAVNSTSVNSTTGMRRYFDTLTFYENQAAGLTREPTVKLYTQDANGRWSDPAIIEAVNPPPPVPAVRYAVGTEFVIVAFDQPADNDFLGFAVWASKTPGSTYDTAEVRYAGAGPTFTLDLDDDEDYYIGYGAYDAFGPAGALTAEFPVHTISLTSLVIPLIDLPLDEVGDLIITHATAADTIMRAYVDDEHTAMLAEVGTVVDDLSATITTVNGIGARMDTAEAAIVTEQTTRASADSAMASQITTLQADVGDNEAAIIAEQTARANADTAITNSMTTQFSTVNGNIATIQSVNTTQATTLNTHASRLDILDAQYDDVDSRITTEQSVRAAADSTAATQITNLTSRLNNPTGDGATIESKFSTQATLNGQITASYILKTEVLSGGRRVVGGFGFVNNGTSTEFAVKATRFVVASDDGVTAGYPFEIVAGRTFIKDAYIKNANIEELSINGEKLENFASTSVGTFFADLSGWNLSSTSYHVVGGSAPCQVTITTGNGTNRVIIDVNATMMGDGGDDDNLNWQVWRLNPDGSHTVLPQTHGNIQVSDGQKRVYGTAFFDNAGAVNTTYTYKLMEAKVGTDGNPYYYNTSMTAVCYKK